ncbi:hypothetical protein NF212_06590 [Parasalinivibrio latis]|uniref:hypothetical protein n=1 Tax=Parasalinivibrio latis TaxID=2952610 RepID=UPI0030DF03DA
MDIDDLVVYVLGGILRTVKYVIIDFILFSILFWYGCTILLIVTLGQYPRGQQRVEHRNILSFFGVFSFSATVVIWQIVNSAIINQ